MSAVANYFALTKPRLLPLVLFSGLPAMALAAGGWPPLDVVLITLLGTSLAAGAANTLNSYIERDLDAQMERTRVRPLPSGLINATRALAFGLVLGVAGTGLLWFSVGPVPALIALAAILFYVFIYTLWLKPRTPFAVVVGGVSGAIAPLIADAAVDGHVSLLGWLLFGIIFIWQPPHFYAIALFRRADYAEAGFPMLHDRIGEEATRRRILYWILALVPVTLAPAWFSSLGGIYVGVSSALLLGFFVEAVKLYRQRDTATARRVFLVSLLFLMGTFGAMIVDLAWASLIS